MNCETCGNPMVLIEVGQVLWPTCPVCDREVDHEVESDIGQRLDDGFALLHASEDPKINPDEHIS